MRSSFLISDQADVHLQWCVVRYCWHQPLTSHKLAGIHYIQPYSG